MLCKLRPYKLQGGLTSKYNEYTPEERAKTGSMASKMAQSRLQDNFLNFNIARYHEVYILVEGPNGQI